MISINSCLATHAVSLPRNIVQTLDCALRFVAQPEKILEWIYNPPATNRSTEM